MISSAILSIRLCKDCCPAVLNAGEQLRQCGIGVTIGIDFLRWHSAGVELFLTIGIAPSL